MEFLAKEKDTSETSIGQDYDLITVSYNNLEEQNTLLQLSWEKGVTSSNSGA